MDINPIDIKIKEFALYLKDFGLLNETNINDFLKKFKNTSDNSIVSSGIYETDINVGLIYLKENLSKAMLEFYGLMTEERKKITYLNIYSKFIQKREKDLKIKGEKIYNIYSSHIIKKYFNNWKKENLSLNDLNNNNNKNKNNKKNSIKISNISIDYKKDNFCFDIIANNELSNNNNVIINSNNNKIIFNTSNSTKFNSSINNINNSLINSNNNNNFNSFLLNSKSRLSDKNIFNNDNIIQNNLLFSSRKNEKNIIYNKPKIIKENVLDKLFYPKDNNNKQKDNNNNKLLYNINSSKNINKSYNYNMRHSVDQSKKINNIKKNGNSKNNNIKTVNKYKDKEKEEFNTNQFTTPKMRNSYNPSRPKSSLQYNNYNYNNENNKINVYQRLYDQNKEKIKRQEERIKENLNEIKERANHPIQRNSYNNFRNFKKNKNNSSNSNKNLYSNKYKIQFDEEDPNFFNRQYVSKKIEEVLFDKSHKEKKSRYSTYNDNNNSIDDNDQKKKDGQNFIESQRKCIELFNDMIDKEEKRGGKVFNEIEKENMFKDLLNKLYIENKNDKITNNINNININEDEKVNEQNNNVNNLYNSAEIKRK